MRFQITDPGDRSALTPVVDAVERLLALRVPRCGAHSLVCVDGRSGAGKTALASALATALHADLLHLDDMYQGWWGLLPTVSLVRAGLVEALARGTAAQVPTWDWVASRRGPDRPVQPGARLVLEGVGSFAAGADHAGVRVWVEAPETTRRERALARDGATYEPWWQTWAAQEADYLAGAAGPGVLPGAAAADVVVDTAPAPLGGRAD